MALLIVEHDGKMEAGVISGRVIVGRRPESQVRAASKAVAPIHAWIGVTADGTHFIADAGSKSGTFVNDQRVVVRTDVRPGDRIRIGSLALRLEEGQAIPVGATPLDLHQRAQPTPSPEAGIVFDCTCGAPMWAPWDAAGKRGRCRICGAPIAVPRPVGPARPDATTPQSPPAQCGICHGAIQPGEETKQCPSCKALFHIECWTENGGCSVYGCSQVNSAALREPDAAPVVSSLPLEEHLALAHGGMPLAYALLAVSVLGAVAGTLTFGATALVAGAAALLYLFRARPQRQRRVVFLSIAVSLTGAVAGLALSYYWWVGGRTWLPTR